MKLAVFGLAVLLLTTTGCLIIPVPESEVLAGHKITDENTAFIQIGATTRNEVIRELGQPQIEFEDQRIVAYTWEMLSGYFLWGAWFASKIEEVSTLYVLLVAFDENDRVSRFEKTTRWAGNTIQELASKWVKREAMNTPIPTDEFTETAIPSGKAAIYIYRPGEWTEPLLLPVVVTLDGKTAAELKKGRYKIVILAPGSHTISTTLNPSRLAPRGTRTNPHEPFQPFSLVAVADTVYYLEVKFQFYVLIVVSVIAIRSHDDALSVIKTLERVW